MDIEALKSFRLAPIEHRYSAKDSILYALGLGYGERPADPGHLQFVYEKDLKAVPSASVVLAHPGFWVSTPALKIAWIKILHGEQSFEIHQPLSVEGVVRGEYEIVAVEDKGGEKGAVMHNDRLERVEYAQRPASAHVAYRVVGGERFHTHLATV